MRKLKLFFTTLTLVLGVSSVNAQEEDYTSYITNADMSSKDGWTLTATGGEWSDIQGSAPSYVLEAYAGWGSLDLKAYTIKQNVTLPSGKYRAEGYAFYRYGLTYDVDPSISNAKFVAGDFSSKVVSLGSETLDATLTAYPDNTAQASAAFTNGYYKSEVEFAIESESTIEFGYEGTHTLKQSWFIAGPIKLYRTGDFDYTLYQSQLESLVAEAKSLQAQGQTMAASYSTALDNVITTYDGQTCTSVAAYNAAYAAINEAIANAETSIASYAIIASGTIPDNSLNGWVCENSNTFHINTWSVEGNPGNDPSGMVTPFIENWVGKGSYLGAGKVYYKLEGLEPGEVYYAQALVRSYNEANSDAPNGPNFFINDVVTSLSDAGTTFTYDGMSGIYATLGGAATVGSDGTLTLGVVIASDCNYNWVAFKNVSIQSMDDAFNAAVAKVTALEGTIPTAAYNTAYAVVTNYSGDNYPTTAAGFETAIAAIEAAATTASALVSPYAKFITLKNQVQALYDVTAYTESVEGAHTTLGTAITTATTDVEEKTTEEEINAIITTLKTAGTTYNNSAEPTDEAQPFTLTFMLTNPDLTGFATWAPAAGWASEETDGNSQVMVNDSKTFGDKSYFYEYWSETAKASGNFALYNAVTLPAGTYTMSCYAFAEDQNTSSTFDGVYFYANDTQGSCVTATVLTQQTLSFVNSEEQEVKIGLKTVTGNTRNWMGIGYVELYKVPAKTYTVDEGVAWDNTTEGAGDVTLNRTIKAGVNTLVLPFSMTQDEVESAFGTGSKVYTIKSYNATSENLSFETHDGISANTPCLLKATEASDGAYTLEGRTIVAGEPTASVSGASMIGTYADVITVPQDGKSFIISNGSIYKVASVVTLKNTRAFIQLDEAPSTARALSLSFDGGETTGIATLENGELKVETGVIYDLSGRRVTTLGKGIYVINGKKVVK